MVKVTNMLPVSYEMILVAAAKLTLLIPLSF